VITKGELLEQARCSVASIADEVEKLIDDKLKRHVAEKGVKGYVTYQNETFEDAVMEELARRYTDNEYRAEYCSSQTEGKWLQIWLD
jgi:hypothetical protein